MNEQTNEALNRLIHTQILKECWKDLDTLTDDGFCTKCGFCISAHRDPSYSTQIEHAMLAVERMRGEGWYFEISSPFASWSVCVDTIQGGYRKFSAIDASLPRAICLCIAKAEGLEVKNAAD